MADTAVTITGVLVRVYITRGRLVSLELTGKESRTTNTWELTFLCKVQAKQSPIQI
jgi:hypothetical protein